MAPLSVLPGRLRFEPDTLNGNQEGCLLVEESLRSLPGVKEVSASHRTGRVLVVFAEEVLPRNEIEAHLHGALKLAARAKVEGAALPQFRRNTATREESQGGVGHFIMEIAMHAFLPAPLELLIPAAAALRR
jgi:copper chaperone CopZ